MAGDWIKIEKATARKPEVLAIAEILNIHPDHAFGLCVRFWAWCDDHLSEGNARSVTKTSLDALLERSGFADALIKVDWLQVRSGSLEVPNFDRHLSQTAKKRGLTAQRVAEHKAKKGNAQNVTEALPEKRREENISLSKARAKSEEEVIEYVRTLGLPDTDGSHLWNTWEANGWMRGSQKIKDWKAAVRTWQTGGYLPSQKSGKTFHLSSSQPGGKYDNAW